MMDNVISLILKVRDELLTFVNRYTLRCEWIVIVKVM
jgi:hypothetical protein